MKEMANRNEGNETDTGSKPPTTENVIAVDADPPLHPYCAMLPVASKEEITALAADISRNGLRDPIVMYKGQILDGRNRLFACKLAGVKPRFVEYDAKTSDKDLFQFVISKNISRRHLTTSQRALIAARMSVKRKDKTKKPQICGFKQIEAAELLVAKLRLVQDAAKLLREAPPELVEEVERGEKTVHAALDVWQSIKSATLAKNVRAVVEQKTAHTVTSETDTPKLSTPLDESDNRHIGVEEENKQVDGVIPDQSKDGVSKDTPEQMNYEDVSATNPEPTQPTTSTFADVPDNVVQPRPIEDSKEPDQSAKENEEQPKSYLEQLTDDLTRLDQTLDAMPETISLDEYDMALWKVRNLLQRQRKHYRKARYVKAYFEKQAALDSAKIEEANHDSMVSDQIGNTHGDG